MKVNGVSFRDGYPENLHQLEKLSSSEMNSEPAKAMLVRDPGNEFDSNAIEIHVEPVGHIGFVPSETAAWLASDLDNGMQLRAEVWVRISKRYADRPGAEIRISPATSAD